MLKDLTTPSAPAANNCKPACAVKLLPPRSRNLVLSKSTELPAEFTSSNSARLLLLALRASLTRSLRVSLRALVSSALRFFSASNLS